MIKYVFYKERINLRLIDLRDKDAESIVDCISLYDKIENGHVYAVKINETSCDRIRRVCINVDNLIDMAIGKSSVYTTSVEGYLDKTEKFHSNEIFLSKRSAQIFVVKNYKTSLEESDHDCYF